VTPARSQRYMLSFSSPIHRIAWVSFPRYHFGCKYLQNFGETASNRSWIGILFRWQDLVVARLRERGKGFEVQLVEQQQRQCNQGQHGHCLRQLYMFSATICRSDS
jgi:hypothetical protein